MPRGHLKHSKHTSHKQARGGSSHSVQCRDKTNRKPNFFSRHSTTTEDDILYPKNESRAHPIEEKPYIKKDITALVSKCMVCFEDGPVVKLSNKCGWHEQACHQCLRRLYVTDAQKESKNFPLQCFHPLCQRPIQCAQLEKHGLIVSEAEVKNHHKMQVLSRIRSVKGARTVLCPSCEAPRCIKPHIARDYKHTCNNCGCYYRVSPDIATIQALERVQSDSIGRNDGLARCPKCGVLISKGDGCNHMTCAFCEADFGWEEAVREFGLLARPPSDEIYLWW